LINHKIPNITLTCLVVLLLPIRSFAQTNEGSENRNVIQSFAKTVYCDVLTVASSPARMSKQDVLRLSVFVVVTAGFISSFDSQVNDEFVKTGNERDRDNGLLILGKRLAKIGYAYNDIKPVYFFAGLSTTILVGGLIYKDKKLLETTRLMVESFVITGAITTFGKGFLGRSRPFTGKGAHDFNFFKFSIQNEYLSMPSGHTSGIFSILTVIAKQYDHWWIKLPAYTLGLSVALQRIDAHQHWASDVIVGGALGYWVGNTLVNKYKNQSHVDSFHPYISPNQVGINISF
jgi:membrane-associated phospholipid phosphatase